MKHLELLQKYLANTAVLNLKMHNVHWNVVGLQFLKIHTFTEAFYDKLFADLDEVAELLKMKNKMPLSTMSDYLKTSNIQEVKEKDFSIKESLEIIEQDMTIMKNLAVEIRNIADDEGDFETVSIFEDHVAYYSKNLWFIHAMKK